MVDVLRDSSAQVVGWCPAVKPQLNQHRLANPLHGPELPLPVAEQLQMQMVMPVHASSDV